MGGTGSTRFFWHDWLSDIELRACSYAARGLWMDMLAIAAENGGYLQINGRGLKPADLARITGGTVAEVESLLAELETNGVSERDRRGVLYSRRMVRGEKLRRNGRLGGNPKLLKSQGNPDLVNQKANPSYLRNYYTTNKFNGSKNGGKRNNGFVREKTLVEKGREWVAELERRDRASGKASGWGSDDLDRAISRLWGKG